MLRMNNRIALGSNLGKSIGNGTTNRYFSTLDGAADYYTIPTVTLTGDFELSFYTDSKSVNKMLLSGGTGTSGLELFLANDNIQLYYEGVSVKTFTGYVNDGKLNLNEFIRVSNTLSYYVNGVFIDSYVLVGNVKIDTIGARTGGGLKLDGVISDVKITDGTDLIRYYKIDEDLSATSTIIDSGSDGSNGTAVSITSSELFTLEGADWIGAELVVNGDFATDSDWTKETGVTINGGVCSSDGSMAAYSPVIIQTSLPLTVTPYKTVYTMSNVTANGTKIILGLTSGTQHNANGTYSEIITSDGANPNVNIQAVQGNGKYIGDLDNVSVKRILQAP